MTYDLDDTADDLETLGDKLDENREQLEQLKDERSRLNQQQKQTVVDALYDLQDSLDDGESITLIEAEEWSRGGHYEFDQTLTPDGIVAQDVRRVFRGHGYTFDEDGEKVQLTDDDVDEEYYIKGEDKYCDMDHSPMYGWEGNSEPLDIEDEYLTWRRDTPAFIDKLAARLKHLAAGEDSIPRDSQGYD